MLGPDALEKAPKQLENLMLQIQDYGIKDIARRIAQNGHITATAAYQITTLMEQDIFQKDFKGELQRILGLSDQQINKLFTEASKANYIYDRRAFKARGIPFVPFEDNYLMQTMTNNIISATQNTLRNITSSLGFAREVAGQIIFQDPAAFYQSELDLATISITTGMKTFDKAIRDAVEKMADSGMRTVDYKTGHHDRIDVAARRAVMGGMRDLTNFQSDYNAIAMNSTVYEISWHGGYRPSHAWGGRRFDTTGRLYPTEEELYRIYTSPEGKIGNLGDYNCYHEKYAVFPDSPPTYSDQQLKQMDKDQKVKRKYEGKEYTEYEARQQQRYLERIMRKQKSVIAGLKGASEVSPDPKLKEDLRNARIKYKLTRGQYKDFSETMGLTPELKRVNTGFVA